MLEEVTITKLVHGGQGLGTLTDGRKVFVWNALAGERVLARILKSKKSYAEAIAEKILQAAPDRIEPREANYLATSPWQILEFDSENRWKKEITQELFQQAGVNLPDFTVQTDGKQFNYRNKMEYSFWGDDEGIHLALHNRGSHQKQIVEGSALALASLDNGAKNVVNVLPANTRAGDLKTIIIRSSQNGDVAVSLFVKREDFYKLPLPPGVKGMRVYFSNPKSPASVPTRLLYELGDCRLVDSLLGESFTYDSDSFFQVNVPVFELALQRMRTYVRTHTLTDMYAGVGSIGLSLAKKTVDLIELDPATAAMARLNASRRDIQSEVIEAAAERTLELIPTDRTVIFDPPRAGLHEKIVNELLEKMPPRILYLSCNPATQARDIAKLQSAYALKHFDVFNFFPRTPHIESLAILVKK